MNEQSFSRRTFLRGAGVSMALPWMESLRVWGDESKRPELRARHRCAWRCCSRATASTAASGGRKGSGANMELGQVLAPLADFREKMLFIRGLYNAEAQKGNIHSSQTGNLLSGAPLASGGEIRSGTSFDQLLARAHGQSTKVPSLVLALREVESVGAQELFDALQLAHLLDVADDADSAGALPRAGVRPPVPR